MLSRFVLPTRRLPDLSRHRQLLKTGATFRLSVLGTGGGDPETFLSAFARDLDVIESFDADHEERAQVEVMEVPLPNSLVGSSQSEVTAFLEALNSKLLETGTAKLDLFLEVPMQKSAVQALSSLSAAVADHNSRQALPARMNVGLKMRCGGAEPTDVPSVEHAATLITASRDASIPFKATAGLHHPVRHYDDGLDTDMHGFLNIFGASVMAAEHALNPSEVGSILREESGDNFRFLKTAFSWRDLTVSLEGIRHARDNLAISFGSCSFEEPIDHLREMELL